MEQKFKELLSLVDKIPEKYWVKTDGSMYEVVWLLNRQKPSVQEDYSFDEERLGITKTGKIIWGFDSGCSCPSPWSNYDYGDDKYLTAPTYKEFIITNPSFDGDWEDASSKEMDVILGEIKYHENNTWPF